MADKAIETVKAVYTGTNPIVHDHGTLKPNQGLVELEKGNYEKLKKLFPNTLKSAEEASAEYRQVGTVQVGAHPATTVQGSPADVEEGEADQTDTPQPKKAGRPPKNQ